MLQAQKLGSLMGSGLHKAQYCIYEEDFIGHGAVNSTLGDLQHSWQWAAFGVGAAIPTRSTYKDEAFWVLRVSTGSAGNSYVTGQLAGEWLVPTTSNTYGTIDRSDAANADFGGYEVDTVTLTLLAESKGDR